MRWLAPATLCAVTAALAAAGAAHGQPPPVSTAPGPVPAISFDLVVLDKDGRMPDALGPADLSVSVDGKPRRVLSVTRVSRGPGAATDAASRLARATGPTTFAAEPVRNVIVVVDQASLVRGEERAAIAASHALLDRLGMADRLAVVLLPFPRDQMLSLATEQPAARETLARAAGRIDPAAVSKADVAAAPPPVNPMMSDPDRLREAESVPVPAPAPAPAASLREAESAPPTGILSGLAGLMEAIRTVPGRKVVAFFSAGLIDPSPVQVSEIAAAAVAARAAIHVFTMPGLRDSSVFNLQLSPLEALAKATGGAIVAPGRNLDRTIGRTAAEIAACYTLELEPAATDADGRRRALRVEVAGRGLTVRAPAWFMPAPDPEDVPAALPAPPAGAQGDTPRGETAAEAARPAERSSAKEAELQLAMARMVDYVEAYQRQYSGLVAEEEYTQSSRGGKNVRLRSDYLLVKPDRSPVWMSFRDVYEVDGVAVRDRDDRLKRLFLDPGLDLGTQLQAILDEGARYNLNLVKRNVNVPLYLLSFLTPANRSRFRFRLAGTRQVEGVDAWRIGFEEQVFPTLIVNDQGRDVPAEGWFLVSQLTGAILETVLSISELGSTGEIKVSFRHDPALGMWVPEEMTEVYRVPTGRSMSGAPRPETYLEGTATYSKFRRFQVKIDEGTFIRK